MGWTKLKKRLSDRLGIPRSFALNELDLKLDRIMSGKRGGFFIEAGANDGLAQSNTLFFERFRGWSGLLVEPIPENFERCQTNRPTAIVANAALVPFDFVEPTVQMRYCNLMSMVKGGLRSAEDEAVHIEAGGKVQGGIGTYEVAVRARSLQSILDYHGIKYADLVVLDVEGFEAPVLRGIDFNRFEASNLLIEARYQDEIEEAIGERYEMVEQLSYHDLLYRPRLSNSSRSR